MGRSSSRLPSRQRRSLSRIASAVNLHAAKECEAFCNALHMTIASSLRIKGQGQVEWAPTPHPPHRTIKTAKEAAEKVTMRCSTCSLVHVSAVGKRAPDKLASGVASEQVLWHKQQRKGRRARHSAPNKHMWGSQVVQHAGRLVSVRWADSDVQDAA